MKLLENKGYISLCCTTYLSGFFSTCVIARYLPYSMCQFLPHSNTNPQRCTSVPSLYTSCFVHLSPPPI